MVDINEIKNSSDKVEKACGSQSICMAKFYQSTVHFQLGKTHSCYHLPHHQLPVKELKALPSIFHNTKIKSDERALMKSGLRPQGCNYCWNIEDLAGEQYSDRQMWNWFFTREGDDSLVHEMQSSLAHFAPRYLEVSFGNECNMNCGYCHPQHSSKFHAEIVKHGPYDVDEHKCNVEWFKVYKEADNPFLEQWWPYWEEIKDQVKVLRVTGGEPLIQKSTYRLIDSIKNSNLKNLELDFNSNMSIPTEILNKFILNVKSLVSDKKIKRLKLFASIDTWGKEAEFVRAGLNLQLFEKNIIRFLEETEYEINFMVTFNIFSVFNFRLLLEKFLELRTRFKYDHLNYHRVRFDINYLREPIQFDFRLLPFDYLQTQLEEAIHYMNTRTDDQSLVEFAKLEVLKLQKVLHYIQENPMSSGEQEHGRRQFLRFFKQYEQRKKITLKDYCHDLWLLVQDWDAKL